MNLEELKLNIPYISRDDLKELIYEDEILNIYKNDWQTTCYKLWRSKFYHPEAVEPSIFWLSQFVKPQSEHDFIFRFRVYSDATVYMLLKDMPFGRSQYSFIIIKRDNPRKILDTIKDKQLKEVAMLNELPLGKLLHEFTFDESVLSRHRG